MKNKAAIVKKIAEETLLVYTLKTRNSDSLDFHDIAVWNIKKALEEAYEAGLKAAQKGEK